MSADPRRTAGRRGRVGRCLVAALAVAGAAWPTTGRAPVPVVAAQDDAGPAPGRAGDSERDPFVRPPPQTPAPPATVVRGRGLRGLRVGEARLVGIVTTEGARLAVLEAPDGTTWMVRPGDRLADGVMRAVTADAAIFAPSASDGSAAGASAPEVRVTLGAPPGAP